ncbi:hypothetical protein [Peteryoungia ipomoeae]|uniref:Uncharacterized protein n=1 Tax=Peteryoungia ipomoeae TaxID=1210932 RepID=A0A4S8NRV1_9HYPH|nr:hypothetical protein [Peteryoungia ipomoeae]THV19848.1 hypothetical protein FAA97_19920 [Peteryoungia ipomoeae]
MIASTSGISSSSVAMLFGTSGASSTDSSSAATTILSIATGHTDDVFKAGNAIGKIIEITQRMKQDAEAAGEKVEVEEIKLPNDTGRSLSEFDGDSQWFALNGTFTKTQYGNGESTETFAGVGQVMTDAAYRQSTIDGLKQDQSTLRNKTMLAAFQNGTIQETDISELGFSEGMTMTLNRYSDGHAEVNVQFDNSGAQQFREQHTESRDGVLYDKETGKFAAIGQNGSKFIYFTW